MVGRAEETSTLSSLGFCTVPGIEPWPQRWEARGRSAPVGLIYLGFYVAFNTVQAISRQVVGRAEETSTLSSLGFCTVPGIEPWPQRWEARVLPLCHRGPLPRLEKDLEAGGFSCPGG